MAADRLGSSSLIEIETSDSEKEHERSCGSPDFIHGMLGLPYDQSVASEYFDPGFLDQYGARRPSVRRRATRENRDLEGIRLPFQVNPMSTLKNQDLSRIRESYSIPASVMLRVPRDYERADSPGPNEIVVYEAYFALGLREKMIVEVSKFFDISPSQFTPSAWRMLTAIQVFGELHSQELGVKEVLYAHYFRHHDIDASRYIIRRRPNSDPLVFDLQTNQKRTAFYEKDWQKKYLFMNVGHNPPFPITWCLRDIRAKRCEEGEPGASKVFAHLPERRSVKVLIDNYSLRRSTIWGAKMSLFDGLEGDAAFEKYRLADIASSSITRELSVKEKETPSRTTLKRNSTTSESVGVPPKPSKKAATGGGLLISPSASGYATIANQLNEKAFGLDFESFEKLGTSVIFPQTQAELLKAASLCHFADTQLRKAQTEKMKDLDVIADLRQQLDLARKRENDLRDDVLARDQEIEIVKSDKDSVSERVANLEVRVKEMQQEKLRLEKEVELAGFSAATVCRWNLIKEFKRGKADTWDAQAAETNYRRVLISEATRKGKEPPVYPESFTNFDNEDPSSVSTD